MRSNISPSFPALLTSLTARGSERAKVFATILSGQATSRREVMELLSLRSTSVSADVNELLEQNFLTETLGPRLGRGRPSQVLAVNMNRLVTLVFHVINQSLHVVAVNLAEQILCHDYEMAEKSDGNSELTEKFRLLLKRIMKKIPKTSQVAGIAFSLSGLIDSHKGEWVFSSRWPRMHNLIVRDIFLNMHCPVIISRNMDSELRSRLYRETGSTILFHWGYGIGASFGTPAGHIATGTDGFGEIGHWHVTNKKIPCRCGRQGCLETVAALWSIGPHFIGADFNISEDEDKLAARIAALDISCLSNIDEALRYTITALSNLSRIFFPQKIIVSGPMTAHAFIWTKFKEEFFKENAFINLPQPKLVIGHNSRQHELLGAASPVFEHYLLSLLSDRTA